MADLTRYLLLTLVFGISFVANAMGKAVVLTSPPLNHGLVYLNKNSASHWQISGSSLSSPQTSGSHVDAYYALPDVYVSPAKEVVIDVTYTLQCCSHILKIGFYALVTSTPSQIPLSPMQYNYVHVGDLTNSSLIQESRSKVFITRIYVLVEGQPYLYIAFRNQGFYGSVDAIRMNYYKCEAVTKNFVHYPETPAPRKVSNAIEVSGRCAQQAFPTGAANSMICYSNGTSKVNGGCQCIAGYENTTDSVCSACPPKTFKSSGGNYHCSVCGANVVDPSFPRTKICQCMSGFFKPRAYLDAFHVNCEEPPSEPRNANIDAINSTWVSVVWNRPDKIGTGNNVWYLIRCNTRSFKSINESITITGLLPFTLYNVTIASNNNVTAATGVTRTVSISFTTLEGLPPMVQNLTYTNNKDFSVTVHWKEPILNGRSSLSYGVVVNRELLKIIQVTEYTISQKNITYQYNVTVMSRTSFGFSKGQTVQFTIKARQENTTCCTHKITETPLGIIIGLSIGGIVVGLIIFVTVCCLLKRRKQRGKKPDGITKIGGRRDRGVDPNPNENAKRPCENIDKVGPSPNGKKPETGPGLPAKRPCENIDKVGPSPNGKKPETGPGLPGGYENTGFQPESKANGKGGYENTGFQPESKANGKGGNCIGQQETDPGKADNHIYEEIELKPSSSEQGGSATGTQGTSEENKSADHSF